MIYQMGVKIFINVDKAIKLYKRLQIKYLGFSTWDYLSPNLDFKIIKWLNKAADLGLPKPTMFNGNVFEWYGVKKILGRIHLHLS